MRIPITDIKEYLNTEEMRELIQKKLNMDELVIHQVIGTKASIEIRAYLDKEQQVVWEILKDFLLSMSDVETEDLALEIKFLAGQDA